MRGDSGSNFLVDTDVFIDHIRGAHRVPSVAGSYSVITRCELFAGDEKDEPAVRGLLALHEQIGIDDVIAERAGQIRRAAPGLRTPDALIAATALEHALELITRNRRDFAGIRGLRVRDPATL